MHQRAVKKEKVLSSNATLYLLHSFARARYIYIYTHTHTHTRTHEASHSDNTLFAQTRGETTLGEKRGASTRRILFLLVVVCESRRESFIFSQRVRRSRAGGKFS